ncbi:uncharacterized protein LOC130670473 [Microplitis mediator]|uniref:uncharacterized protein LOC130670473 n=1 Tax=Microplitis mediator TaxID=375433 RepID=UPI0025578614|nr:uncharacterized protein LOC130670473 [Microplitis mediator]
MSHAFRRGQLKAAITKFETFLSGFTDTPINQAKLQQRINNLKEIFNILPEITMHLATKEPEGGHNTIEEEMMEDYMDILAQAELERNLSNQEANRDNAHTPAVLDTSNHNYNLTKMPKRELRKFDGKLEEWKSFYQWFNANVHDRVGISDSTHMSYLQDTLIGEAAKTIAGLEATNENYKEAMELLKATYNNEEAIITRHFELLTAIPKLQNNSGDAIRQLVNETLVHVRGMKVLGEPTDKWDVPLLFHTISKLDSSTKREWYRRKNNNKKRTFNELIEFLREEAMKSQTNLNKDNKAVSNPSKPITNNPDKTTQQKQKQVFTMMIFKNCPICKQDGHATYRCDKLLNLSVPQRINAVKNANLCFNCLRNNHKTNDCNKANCFKCGKVHHTLLHLHKPETKEDERND